MLLPEDAGEGQYGAYLRAGCGNNGKCQQNATVSCRGKETLIIKVLYSQASKPTR